MVNKNLLKCLFKYEVVKFILNCFNIINKALLYKSTALSFK